LSQFIVIQRKNFCAILFCVSKSSNSTGFFSFSSSFFGLLIVIETGVSIFSHFLNSSSAATDHCKTVMTSFLN